MRVKQARRPRQKQRGTKKQVKMKLEKVEQQNKREEKRTSQTSVCSDLFDFGLLYS